MEQFILRRSKSIEGKGLTLRRTLSFCLRAPKTDGFLYLIHIIKVKHLEISAVTAPCKPARL